MTIAVGAAPGVDKTALGWFLSGGATHWTAGGLQAALWWLPGTQDQ